MVSESVVNERTSEKNRVFILDWPRPVLHARINARVETMFATGLVDEVRGLLDRFGELGQTARQAAGYREVLELLRGERTLEDAIEKTKARSRQLARRQLIWLRALENADWISMSNPVEANRVAETIVEKLDEF